jgi:hypothetical protein
MRRIPCDQAPRTFIARQRDQLGIQLGAEADRVAAAAAVLRVRDRMVVECIGHREQRRALHQRHVAGQHQPAGGLRSCRDTCGDRVAHAERRRIGEPTAGSTITSRDATWRRARSASASVVTTTTGRWLAIAWRSVEPSTVLGPTRCASL